ncbi:hypothetical protein WR25_16237 [Diploscapter pachys]|uniref:CX domain-containing protein n=1 Tax=Diploscapter pachys TaxID=2018661 RepID=A0A2A2KNF7_9BILA|nr:hypothetical protein WR25_16237 [Diploscapter pachys]
MKFSTFVAFALAYISAVSSRSSGGGRGSSGSRSSSSGRSGGGFSFGGSRSGSSVSHFHTSSSSISRPGSSAYSTGFHTQVYSSGGLRHVTTTNTYVITQPSRSISYGGNYYYFGTGYYHSSGRSYSHVCIYDIENTGNSTNSTTKIPFGNIKFENGTRLTQIVYGCGSGYYCCDFDCCYNYWNLLWIGLTILIIAYICYLIYKYSKNNCSVPEEDKEVTVITTTTTTVYPEYGMYIPPHNASNVRVPSPTPSQKSYVPPAVYPAAPGTNSSTSNNLSVPSAPPSYQPSLTKPDDPVAKVL